MRAFVPTVLLLAAPAIAAADDGSPAAAPASAPATPAAPSGGSAPAVPTPALIEKLGRGDRMFLAGDYRSALFAYQDAVYLQPGYAPARVKLGRAYLAMRYPERALAQAEAALAADPENADARKLRDDATSAASRSNPAPAAPSPDSARPGARVFPFTPEPEPEPQTPAAAQAPK